jgi:rubrerythrin
MLAGKGFSKVINMSGGIKAWDSNTAFGPEDTGMSLFTGKEGVEEILLVAYALEAGLQEFYTSMPAKVNNAKVNELFAQLSEIEAKHQDRIFAEYQKITASQESREQFERTATAQGMEGGLTTEEYLALYPTDFEVIEEVISLAMGIEAQALDLYQRAAENASQKETKKTLLRIAEEERSHLKQLGNLLDGIE